MAHYWRMLYSNYRSFWAQERDTDSIPRQDKDKDIDNTHCLETCVQTKTSIPIILEKATLYGATQS